MQVVNGENCPKKGVKLLQKNTFCNSSVVFPHFQGSDRRGEFCNFSPFFGDFRPSAFPGPLTEKTTRKTKRAVPIMGRCPFPLRGHLLSLRGDPFPLRTSIHCLIQKNPRAHKNKIGTSPPQPKIPPPKTKNFMDMVFSCRKDSFFRASIKMAQPFPAPELRTRILRTRGVF